MRHVGKMVETNSHGLYIIILQGEGSGNICSDDKTEKKIKNKHPVNHTVFFLWTPDASVGNGLLLERKEHNKSHTGDHVSDWKWVGHTAHHFCVQSMYGQAYVKG